MHLATIVCSVLLAAAASPTERHLVPRAVFDAIAAEHSGERFEDFDVLVYEAVNFMDGTRGTGELAARLREEFFLPVDRAWVDRLVAILRGKGLVG